jgi:threonine dehydrogenase-like Zn-dependent dehydrogenase
MNQLVNSVTVLLSAIVGVAILSVILSKNSQTVAVIGAGTKGFGSLLTAAEGPVSRVVVRRQCPISVAVGKSVVFPRLNF